MAITDVQEVMQLISATEVNSYLEAGWILIAVATGTSRDSDGEHAYFTYSVGRPKSVPAKHPSSGRKML